MQEHFKQHKPKVLQHCIGAGEPLNPEVIRIFKDMSGIEICDGFGQTETILVCGNFKGNPIKPGSSKTQLSKFANVGPVLILSVVL